MLNFALFFMINCLSLILKKVYPHAIIMLNWNILPAKGNKGGTPLLPLRQLSVNHDISAQYIEIGKCLRRKLFFCIHFNGKDAWIDAFNYCFKAFYLISATIYSHHYTIAFQGTYSFFDFAESVGINFHISPQVIVPNKEKS